MGLNEAKHKLHRRLGKLPSRKITLQAPRHQGYRGRRRHRRLAVHAIAGDLVMSVVAIANLDPVAPRLVAGERPVERGDVAALPAVDRESLGEARLVAVDGPQGVERLPGRNQTAELLDPRSPGRIVPPWLGPRRSKLRFSEQAAESRGGHL